MLLQPIIHIYKHWYLHEHNITVSLVNEEYDSLQHQDENLVTLAPALVWGSCALWHPLQSPSSCFLYWSSLWGSLQWYFTSAKEVGTARISFGVCLSNKGGQTSRPFTKKKRKITEITGKEKNAQTSLTRLQKHPPNSCSPLQGLWYCKVCFA